MEFVLNFDNDVMAELLCALHKSLAVDIKTDFLIDSERSVLMALEDCLDSYIGNDKVVLALVGKLYVNC